jgi:glutamate racemase
VTLVGSPVLAGLAEAFLRGYPVEDDAIRAEIAPCFVETARGRTDTVVLACTHFPLLIEAFVDLAPWPVEWIDPAPAIARRVVQLLGPAQTAARDDMAKALFTAGRGLGPALTSALRRFGLAEVAVAAV